jgi:multiple sugar transport system permease protein
MMRERKARVALRAIVATAIGVAWLLPFVGIVMASIRPYSEIVDGWWRLGDFHASLKNYALVLSGTSIPMIRALWNSLFTSILGAAIPALVGSMAAYAFARHWMPGKTVAVVVLLSLMAIPGQMIAIPAFKLINGLGLLDKYGSVILMNTVTALPWIIFFMLNVIKGQDISVEEAAKIDGASDYWIFARIVLPQSYTSLISVGILQFVWSWDSFFWPLICIADSKKLMATQVVPMLRGQFMTDWGALSAASVLVVAVPVALFLAFQKYYIAGSVGFIGDK